MGRYVATPTDDITFPWLASRQWPQSIPGTFQFWFDLRGKKTTSENAATSQRKIRLTFIPDPKCKIMEHLVGKTIQYEFDDAFRTRWLGFDHPASLRCSFTDYPTKRGWDQHQLLDGDLSHAHPSQLSKTPEDMASSAAAMVQSWLYFGFLEGVCEKRIDTGLFISTTIGADGFRTLHSNELFNVLKMSPPITEFLEHHDRDRSKPFDLVAQKLVEASDVCVRLQKFTFHPPQNYPDWAPLLESILPSILLMLEAVEGMFKRFDPGHRRLSFGLAQFPPDAQQKRLQRLIDLGWCPFTLDRLSRTTNISLMSWMDVSQFKREPNHHTSCDRSKCELYQIDRESYKTKHITPTCTCASVGPPLNVLQFSLLRGKIPSITVVNEDSQLRLDVTTFDVNTKGNYVAFSHVWADGLGSVSEVGLPVCQLRKLETIASFILRRKNPCFWIDSLCIPEQQDLRRKAIILMSKTYSCAAAVVVLDREIQKASIYTPSEELFLSICGSGWMGRLWTYQEAALARRLIFQMKDGLYELDPSLLPPPTLPLMTIWAHLAKQLKALTITDVPAISSVQATLRWRQTSKPDDETLAIAGILNIDSSILLKYEGEARKARFWALLQSVPKGIIHLPGPKLSLKGFRWAPQTLLYQPLNGSNTMFKTGEAKCTDDGLIGDFEALVLQETCKSKPDIRICLHEEGRSAYYIIGIDDNNSEFAFDAVLLAGKSFRELEAHASIATAIRLKKPGLRDTTDYFGEFSQRLLIHKTPIATMDVQGSIEVRVQHLSLCLT